MPKKLNCNAPSLFSTTCPYCGVGCGVDVQISTDKILTDLVGSSEHPANFGRLCVKGSKLLETNTVSGRLLSPMIGGKQASCRSAEAVGHVSEAESTSAASMQLGNGWRLSVTSRTSPSSCRNRAAGTWAAHMPSGPRVGPRASRMLCARAVQEAERRYR